MVEGADCVTGAVILMALILQDADNILWSVSIDAGGNIDTAVVQAGTPVTVLLNDSTGHSWQLLISTVGILDPVSITTASYPTTVAIDLSHFLIISPSGNILVGTLYSPSQTVDAVIDALGAFIQPFIGSAQIIRAQVNRVAPPIGSFVELTEILQSDIEYPRGWYDTILLQRNIIGPKRIVVQADFYGSQSGDWCATVKTVFRSIYGASQFPAGIAPLYTDEGHEAPLMTGEQQYERRWILSCSLQFNPIVIVPQQSANVLSMNIVDNVQEVLS